MIKKTLTIIKIDLNVIGVLLGYLIKVTTNKLSSSLVCMIVFQTQKKKLFKNKIKQNDKKKT